MILANLAMIYLVLCSVKFSIVWDLRNVLLLVILNSCEAELWPVKHPV